ncbi:neuroendocrine protein 7B2-like [Liolophura sinensis]|uniref:neuroendocrine protein 7B2-like n=1 Tax=Liolophura sinensis TaxID=3198878 RepID=UPI003158136A
MLSRFLPALVALVGLTNCFHYQDSEPYNHLLSNLYRLAELEPAEDVYEPIKGLDNRDAGWPDVAYTDILNEAQLRDQEYEPQNPLYGYQYVSGGAGEGEQHLSPTGELKNKQEVKTDKVLPAYCNPPNPCPVGYTEKDGCVENFENTADSNREFNAKQECACDAEHMYKCPKGSKQINTKSGEEPSPDVNELNKVMEQLGELDDPDSAFLHPYTNGEKRHSRVAKKSPIRISKRSGMDNFVAEGMGNPYFMGARFHQVAKKSPTYLG